MCCLKKRYLAKYHKVKLLGYLEENELKCNAFNSLLNKHFLDDLSEDFDQAVILSTEGEISEINISTTNYIKKVFPKTQIEKP